MTVAGTLEDQELMTWGKKLRPFACRMDEFVNNLAERIAR
jgi:hypothetical protein